VRAQLLVGQGGTGAQDDDGVDALAPVGVGDADDRALGDRGVGRDGQMAVGDRV
jgi:hypothetical protein